MAKKKRPSLKDYLSTWQVIARRYRNSLLRLKRRRRLLRPASPRAKRNPPRAKTEGGRGEEKTPVRMKNGPSPGRVRLPMREALYCKS